MIEPGSSRAETVPIGNGPLSVAVGAGSVWVTNRDDATVTQVDPETTRVRRTIRTAGLSPYGVAAAGGSAWVTAQDLAPTPG